MSDLLTHAFTWVGALGILSTATIYFYVQIKNHNDEN